MRVRTGAEDEMLKRYWPQMTIALGLAILLGMFGYLTYAQSLPAAGPKAGVPCLPSMAWVRSISSSSPATL